MSDRVEWVGLAELRAALRTLPADLTEDASAIVTRTIEDAADEVRFEYPEVSGELVEKVRTRLRSIGRFGVGGLVVSLSHVALWLEEGTAIRKNRHGANRGEIQPPRHIFVPIMIRARHEMYERLKAMLVSHGLMVSGDAG